MKNNGELFIEGIHNLISKVPENIIKKRNRETINLDSLVILVIEALLENQLAWEITKKASLESYKLFIQKFISQDFFNDCKEMMRCKPSEHKTNYSYVRLQNNKKITFFMILDEFPPVSNQPYFQKNEARQGVRNVSSKCRKFQRIKGYGEQREY